jgi:hypothetical protein
MEIQAQNYLVLWVRTSMEWTWQASSWSAAAIEARPSFLKKRSKRLSFVLADTKADKQIHR